MKLLFLACLSPKTGNNTTAERIRSHLEAAGHACELRDAAEFGSPSELSGLVSRFDAALALHLYKAGRLLLDVSVPYGVIFGGTDINEDVKVQQKCLVMKQVLQKARFAVAFTHRLKEEAELLWSTQSCDIIIQPQGIQTRVAEQFCWSEFLRSSGVVSDCVDQLQVFLLVCGLRRVKDPLYLVQAFSEWHRENPLNVLIIVGPKIDPVLTNQVKTVVQRTAGVFLSRERSREELHASMRRCCALVNSSVSEGMSAAILEALDLGVPVLARDVPGNAALVQHDFNGLLFSCPQDFIFQSQRLLSDQLLRQKLVLNGKTYVEEHHSLDQERDTYQGLVDLLR